MGFFLSRIQPLLILLYFVLFWFGEYFTSLEVLITPFLYFPLNWRVFRVQKVSFHIAMEFPIKILGKSDKSWCIDRVY